MPVAKKKYLMAAILVTAVIIISMFTVPSPYNWMMAMGGYVLLLLISLAYQKTHKQCMATIKELDGKHQYQQLIDYINEIKPLGYNGFVVDSYLLYAYYDLGDFKSYEETVLSIRQTRGWKRPKFEDFRSKVMDNLACIALLKHMADTGEVVYKGNHLMMMQAVEHYKQGNKEEIMALMNDYPKVPKLKKACMYVLSGNFDALNGYYKSEIANEVIAQIKEREEKN